MVLSGRHKNYYGRNALHFLKADAVASHIPLQANQSHLIYCVLILRMLVARQSVVNLYRKLCPAKRGIRPKKGRIQSDTSFLLFNLLAVNHKPGSVVDGHLSGTPVTRRLKPPFREMSDQLSLPFKRCSGWGLQRPYVTIQAGELLPRLSTLTCQSRRYLSVALSLESPPQGVSLHPVLWSPDFPHTLCATICFTATKLVFVIL